ncbi:hypothetical protein [Halococcus sp. IIIV-5B]|uniref:hypothetical protein n=1 Tax=Halococcus sp. IIIV-5B TaxID=2321230 RepID=UPI000E76AF6F|nr:hypothetical protein [Halococcus sp. IIIV-5B]RJT03175.1 hypothetical protein D3261_11880 [Halococcus sp. IIIV-5B]
MSGVTLTDETLVVDRDPNRLDELAIAFSRLLERFDVGHVFVAGYVAILSGRARATQDIDVLVESLTERQVDDLTAALDAEGFWGPAMPLASAYEMLSNGDNIWVAPEDQMTPHLEVKFVGDEFDRASLRTAITAQVGEETIPIGPLELQIAYKLYLGAQKDVEDAVHLYTLFEPNLSTQRLEQWTKRLGVEDEYDRLRRA